MCVCAHGDAERTRKPEVSELEVAIFRDEEVLRLEVSVEDTVGVTVE